MRDEENRRNLFCIEYQSSRHDGRRKNKEDYKNVIGSSTIFGHTIADNRYEGTKKVDLRGSRFHLMNSEHNALEKSLMFLQFFDTRILIFQSVNTPKRNSVESWKKSSINQRIDKVKKNYKISPCSMRTASVLPAR